MSAYEQAAEPEDGLWEVTCGFVVALAEEHVAAARAVWERLAPGGRLEYDRGRRELVFVHPGICGESVAEATENFQPYKHFMRGWLRDPDLSVMRFVVRQVRADRRAVAGRG